MNNLAMPLGWNALWPGAAFVLGLIIGSFANVCIHRVPRGESVTTPRSRCPKCGSPIRAWENIPLLSYLLLRARCARCREPISPRYPLVEAFNGSAYLLLAAQHGPAPRAFALMGLVSALLVLSLIDLEHYILPNVITLPGIVLGVAAAFLPDWPLRPLQSLAAAAGGYVAFAAVAEAYRLARGVEGLGQGDWKLAAMLGAFLGWQQLLLTLFLAALAGSVVGLLLLTRGSTLQRRLPFGSFLGLAGLVAVFTGQPIVDWYRDLLLAR